MENNNNNNNIFDDYTQKQLKEMAPYMITLDPGLTIEKVEKISLYDIANGQIPEQQLPNDINNDIVKLMKDDVGLQKLGVVRITMENGQQYYLQEESHIGAKTRLTMIIGMDQPLHDVSVYRERFYTQAEKQRKGGKSKKQKKLKKTKKTKKTKKNKRTHTRKHRRLTNKK